MKKSIIIWVTAAILVAVAVYTTTNYNKQAAAAPSAPPAVTEQKPSGEQAAEPTQAASADTGQGNAQVSGDRLNLFEAPYDFTLEDLNGNKVKLSSFKGKKIFINFWTTWCGYCKAEMPDIEKLYQETKVSDLVILAINAGESKKTVQDFIKENNYQFTVLMDTDGKVSQLYEVAYLPTSYFIDSEGYLVNGVTSALSLDAMKKYVAELK